MMQHQAWITGIQALQLIGIGPSLLLLAFLLLALEDISRAISPLLFLLSLSAGFFTVLVPLLEWQETGWQHIAMQLAMECFPAACFLLMMQFLRGRIPSAILWLILLAPLMGSGALIYLSQITAGEICVTMGGKITCVSNTDLHSIYMVITGGIIMLLMMLEIIRSRTFFTYKSPSLRDQYWMIIALVLLTVTLLALELTKLTGEINTSQTVWASTMTRLAFVFLMFASFFRIFGGQFAIDMARVPTAEKLLTSQDQAIAERIEAMIKDEKIYREMGMSRQQLADKLSVSESRLSHIINRYFGHNFNILLNQQRVEEAKLRLVNEPKTQVTVIAFEVGFNSIATFNRVFKDLVGMSPSEWRQKSGNSP